MKKKILAVLCAVMLLLGLCPATSFAEPEITVLLNGSKMVFPDQAPVIVNGRTLVPFRAIFEALHCNVEWAAETRGVYATFQDGTYLRVLSMFIDNPLIMYQDGFLDASGAMASSITTNAKMLDVAPTILNDRTVVPLRAVSEILGATVTWQDETKTAFIEEGAPFMAYQAVSESQLKEIFKKSYGEGTALLLPVGSEGANASVEQAARALAVRVKNGESMEAVAASCGMKAWLYAFPIAAPEPDAEALLAKANIGEVTVTGTEDGYYIVSRTALSDAGFEKAKGRILNNYLSEE